MEQLSSVFDMEELSNLIRPNLMNGVTDEKREWNGGIVTNCSYCAWGSNICVRLK